MLRRPWPIVILALLQILTPIANIGMNSWLFHVSLTEFFASFRHTSFFEIYQTFLLMPVAGIALFAMKKWSYPVFLTSWIVGVLGNAQAWRQMIGANLAHSFAPTWLLLLMIVLNLALLIYFMLPSVRDAYYRPNIRWWENQPRYMMAIQAHAVLKTNAVATEGGVALADGAAATPSEQIEVLIENLSQDGMKVAPHGAELSETKGFEPGQHLSLSFRVIDHAYEVQGKVVHTDPGKASGLVLVHTSESRAAFKFMMREFRAMKIERRPKVFTFEDSWEDFKLWLISFKKGPSALLPELPRKK
ncbi:MAG: PilZ domain-containing protein [Methylotenera sp.]|nr:PilZ domain-containing protein [Oligoflexia bacterium]